MRADSIRRFWDRRAREDAFHFVDNRIRYRDPEAEERFWAGGRRDLDGLLDALGMEVSPGERVVEIGCGIGRLTRPLAERAASVVAVDVSARMLELARRLNPDLANVDWLLGDGASLAGIPAASADVCFSYVVFQHIPDPHVTLGYVREIGRVLRPGGTAARSGGPRAARSVASGVDRLGGRPGRRARRRRGGRHAGRPRARRGDAVLSRARAQESGREQLAVEPLVALGAALDREVLGAPAACRRCRGIGDELEGSDHGVRQISPRSPAGLASSCSRKAQVRNSGSIRLRPAAACRACSAMRRSTAVETT